MLSRVFSSVLTGIDALPVEVEADISQPAKHDDFRFDIIGLADTAIREARQRVKTALKKVGIKIKGKILVNLAPAEIKKDGTSFDLPIAIALLLAQNNVRKKGIAKVGFYGELALDGSLKPVRGIIAHLTTAKDMGLKKVFLPAANAKEASLLKDLEIIPLHSLAEFLRYLNGELEIKSVQGSVPDLKEELPLLSEVQGQEQAKRALLIAAAGGHNLLFVGPPGCGKSMLAERLPGILPHLNHEEKLEVARIHSIAGRETSKILAGLRVFRSPHHIISDAGLIGGGTYPRPGEISLAHRGVLFLDEFPEFRRSALESLRGPMETGSVLISRAKMSQRFPATFQLIAAMNPCPCGKLGVIGQECLCSQREILKYLQKLSQPILDRIDLQVSLQSVNILGLKNNKQNNSIDAEYRNQVHNVQKRSLLRSVLSNASLSNQQINEKLKLDESATALLENFAEQQNLSARGYFRILRVACTIADLSEQDEIQEVHVAEALSFRSLDVIKEYVKI